MSIDKKNPIGYVVYVDCYARHSELSTLLEIPLRFLCTNISPIRDRSNSRREHVTDFL